MRPCAELVDGYLTFLGYADRPAPTLESLVELHRRHLARVPYENLAIMLGRPPSVDPLDSLARVGPGRPGGLLLPPERRARDRAADLGYAVTRRGGHVWTERGRPVDRRAEPSGPGRLRAAHRRQPRRRVVAGRRARRRASATRCRWSLGEYEQGGFAYAHHRGARRRLVVPADPLGSFRGVEVGPAPDPADVADVHAALSTPPDGRFATGAGRAAPDAEHVDVVRGCLSHRITPADRPRPS